MSEEKQEKKEQQEKTGIEEIVSETSHSITLKGEKISYSVTTGTIILKDEDIEEGEKEKASIFYIAYIKDDVKNTQKRPLTFSFNGGPGSSSVWLHLGLLGPKRVLMDDNGKPAPPPYKLVDNEFSLFEKTDLVFIDPVSTGYSRSVPKEKPDQFHNVKKISNL